MGRGGGEEVVEDKSMLRACEGTVWGEESESEREREREREKGEGELKRESEETHSNAPPSLQR